MSNDFPRLHFRETFDEYTAFEIRCKGWYSGVVVELEDGVRHPVFFYDPVRLAQDLEREVEAGRPYLAERGMIIVPEVTETCMKEAIEQLHKAGWFRHLIPIAASE